MKGTKFTVRVSEARRSTTISWRANGRSGTLSFGSPPAFAHQLTNQPLPTNASAQAYWNQVLTIVLADLVNG